MPHVSSKELNKKDLQKIYRHLVEAFETSRNKSSMGQFLNDFLTKTEKIMLAKRFTVIYLLSKGVPQSYIGNVLHMSPATIARMSARLETGKYDFLTRTTKVLDASIWDALEKILKMGMPPIAGRGRWKFLYTQKFK